MQVHEYFIQAQPRAGGVLSKRIFQFLLAQHRKYLRQRRDLVDGEHIGRAGGSEFLVDLVDEIAKCMVRRE